MLVTARTAFIAMFTVAFLVAAPVFSINARAASGNIQVCQPSTPCTVGEFLYNDSYAPIVSGAVCTITSRYPNGTLFLSSVSLTLAPESDGWYFHTFTTPATTGIYRTEVRCVVDGETLALDKSFEVLDQTAVNQTQVADAVWNANRSSYTNAGSFGQSLQNIVPSSNDVAVAVWGYSDRSLSTFGTLITDIWSNPTRSMTTFGTLVADIWSNAARTLTGSGLTSGSLATTSDVNSAKSSLATDISNLNTKLNSSTGSITNITNINSQIQKTGEENRLLLEQIVNKPVISNGLEHSFSELQSKIDDSTTRTKQITSNTKYLKSKLNILDSKWQTLNEEQVSARVKEIAFILGLENDDPKKQTLSGQINWFNNSWNWQTIDKLSSQTKLTREHLVFIEEEVSAYGKTMTAQKEIKKMILSSDSLEKLIGTPNSKQMTLYSHISDVNRQALSISKESVSVDNLVADIYSSKYIGIENRVVNVSKEVFLVNKLPKINNSMLASKYDVDSNRKIRNQALALKGVLQANIDYLLGRGDQAFNSTWLEEGSIVFKILITNPSSKISQKVPIKYYLPAEVKGENVVDIDEDLKVEYDAEKGQYYISGEFVLAANQSKTLSVRVDDSVFIISDQKIDSLRKQAEELSKPLANTSYFGQGVTIKSDIDVSLDKIVNLQNNAKTPEEKIRAFREAQIELKAVEAKMDKLKELVAAASSVGSLSGFVGGTQALAVWGLIIIMVAGFVFLTLYMRSIRANDMGMSNVSLPTQTIAKKNKPISEQVDDSESKIRQNTHPKKYYVKLVMIVISVSVVFTGAGKMLLDNRPSQQIEIANSNITTNTDSSEVLGNNTEKVIEQGAKVRILVPKDGVVAVHEGSSIESPILANFESTGEAFKIEATGNWVKINFTDQTSGKLLTGWIDAEFVEEETVVAEVKSAEVTSDSNGTLKYATVIDTPTGYLRVREKPKGTEVGKLMPGDRLQVLKKESNWYRLALGEGKTGWVSGEYLEVK